MVEFAGDHFNLAGIVIEMRLLAGDFEVSGADEIADNVFLLHDALDRVDGLKRCGVHAVRELASILRDELVDAKLQPGEHHATVARTRAPSDGFRFEHDDFRTAFGKRERGRESRESGADDGYVSAI